LAQAIVPRELLVAFRNDLVLAGRWY